MDDGTPAHEILEGLKKSIDDAVNEIYINVKFCRLDVFSMMDILLFLGENYTGELTKYGFYDACYGKAKSLRDEDVGYRLLRDQVDRDLREEGMDEAERTLLLDGLMGWIFYNPGTVHKEEQDKAVLQYIKHYGKPKFNQYKDRVRLMFAELESIAHLAESEVNSRVRDKQATYGTFFRQSFPAVGWRLEELTKLLDN